MEIALRRPTGLLCPPSSLSNWSWESSYNCVLSLVDRAAWLLWGNTRETWDKPNWPGSSLDQNVSPSKSIFRQKIIISSRFTWSRYFGQFTCGFFGRESLTETACPDTTTRIKDGTEFTESRHDSFQMHTSPFPPPKHPKHPQPPLPPLPTHPIVIHDNLNATTGPLPLAKKRLQIGGVEMKCILTVMPFWLSSRSKREYRSGLTIWLLQCCQT